MQSTPLFSSPEESEVAGTNEKPKTNVILAPSANLVLPLAIDELHQRRIARQNRCIKTQLALVKLRHLLASRNLLRVRILPSWLIRLLTRVYTSRVTNLHQACLFTLAMSTGASLVFLALIHIQRHYLAWF